jgi:hypothetical protein
VFPLALAGVLGYLAGRGRPQVLPALGFAGLLVAEKASGVPLSAIGFVASGDVPLAALARGAALSGAFARLGFWGAVGAHLAYEVGGALRGNP